MSNVDNIMLTFHKGRFDELMGVLKDPDESYGKWAYWCCEPTDGHGWTAQPCNHTNEDNMPVWVAPWNIVR
jgi:hypothetical protein